MRNQPFSRIDPHWNASSEPALDPRRRLGMLSLGVIFLLTVIGGRVFYLQHVIAGRFIAPWKEWVVEETMTPGRDGRILSRDGLVLAQDESRYDIAVAYRWLESPPDPVWLRRAVWRELTPEERRDPSRRKRVEEQVISRRSALLAELAKLTGRDTSRLEDRVTQIQARVESLVASVERRRRIRKENPVKLSASAGRLSRLWQLVVEELTSPPDRGRDDPIVVKEELQTHVVVEDVPLEIVAAIQSQPTRFPGVEIRSTRIRAYPHGGLAAHVIGVRAPAPDQTHLPDGEMVGRSGVERSCDALLHGVAGRTRGRKDRRGDVQSIETVESAQHGDDVVLTIDSRLQRTAESLLDAALARSDATGNGSPRGGSLIAMDVWTGEILAMASAPRPSLSVLAHPTSEEWQQLLDDPRRPLFPRALRSTLPAGSLFKVLTAAAALGEGVASADELIHCRGYLDSPDQFRCRIYRLNGTGHGDVNLGDALCQSCNVYFFEMARRIGPDALCDWATRFGFGATTGIDLPGEEAGRLPRPGDSANARWYPGTTLQLAIGQGSLLVTPLQVVRMMAAIANGGTLVTPRICQTPAPEAEAVGTRPQRIEGISESTLAAIRDGLEKVVQDERGTGRAARIDMMSVAGKTGTAETGVGQDHAWFAGYAPAQSPRLAFVVLLEEGGSGSALGPVVREFVLEALGCGYLQPPILDSRETDEWNRGSIDPLASASDTEMIE